MKALSVFHNRPIGLLADKTWQLLPMNFYVPLPLLFLKNWCLFYVTLT